MLPTELLLPDLNLMENSKKTYFCVNICNLILQVKKYATIEGFFEEHGLTWERC
jgi:hypothetical protein